MARPVVAPIKCSKCGSENPSGAAACSHCGTSLGPAVDDGATVVLPGLEADPEVMEVWHRLRDATLGEYDIYAPIGRGGMATVFLALDLALEREVAIKVISPGMIQTQSLVDRFKREARTAAALSHPNIIPVYAVKEHEGLAFFVMKYVEGRSLESIIRREGPLSVDVAVNLLRQVGSALDFAHRKGVIHRDVKPANIMIDPDGWAIVTDFGIAKVAEAGSLTSAGLVVGTPTYMSPEQFSGGAVTGAADQYSLGIMAYEMLTGHSPFGATTIAEMMRSHIMDEPVSPRHFRPDIPDDFSKAVLRMLAKTAAERWATIGEAVESISALPQERQEQARTVMISLAREGARERPRVSVPISPSPNRAKPLRPRPSAAEPAPKKSRAGAWVAALVAAAGIGGGVWYMQQQQTVAPAAPRARTPDSVPHVTRVIVPPESTKAVVDSAPQKATAPPPAAPAATAPQKKSPGSPPPVKHAASSSKAEGTTKRDVAAKPETTRKAGVTAKSDDAAKSDGAAKSDVAAKPDANAKSDAATKTDVPKTDVAAKSDAHPPAVVNPAPTQVSPPPPVVQQPTGPGFVRIGSRIPGAVLYIDGLAVDPLSKLRVLQVPAGKRRIGVHADGCQPWDSTITVTSADTSKINLRNPTCPP